MILNLLEPYNTESAFPLPRNSAKPLNWFISARLLCARKLPSPFRLWE